MKILYFFTAILLLISCQKTPVELKTGTWRGVIELQGQELPFNFEVTKESGKYRVYLQNAEEKLMQDEVLISGDSVRITMLIFDIDLIAKINGDRLDGVYIKNYEPDFKLPFKAVHGEDFRFVKSAKAGVNFSGKYQLQFHDKKETYPSVGIFDQEGNRVIGTFLTPTGDYRYLEGNIVGEKLMLSTFDGNHAFLFSAQIVGDSLKGDFYSGKHSHETFIGVKNEKAEIPNAYSLTFLKKGFDKISFNFPDVDHNTISPSDEKYKGKVLILQVFGTWCPNCMDETNFLSQWYKQNHERGVEILGLAYERKDDFDYASGRVRKMKEKLQVPYNFVIAGTNDKEKASQSLPMLNK
ncbi:MAG: TlpA disulfide reductase family protein, partial [Cyclobacteriaceae bacterium]|nr:TlpA disulfide reductase family protein [Cyclobacteriaceae bacterium]